MKDILFMLFGYIGVIVIILSLFLLAIYLIDKFIHVVSYVVMYREYSRNKELYDIRNNIIIGKNGNIRYSCTGSIDKQIEIVNEALKYLDKLQEMKKDINAKN